MPPVTRIMSQKQALPGVMRISPEGTLAAWCAIRYCLGDSPFNLVLIRPGDNPNQCAQQYNCPPPVIALDNFDTFGNRYVDVGAGGPASFTFSIASNVSWISISQTQGSVTPSALEQRVFFGVKDWSQVPLGTTTAALNFTAIAAKQLPLVVPAFFTVTKNSVPSSFKGITDSQRGKHRKLTSLQGFVEGAGGISIEVAHASRNTTVNGMFWKVLPRYGRTVSGLTPWPRDGNNGNNFTVGAGPTL